MYIVSTRPAAKLHAECRGSVLQRHPHAGENCTNNQYRRKPTAVLGAIQHLVIYRSNWCGQATVDHARSPGGGRFCTSIPRILFSRASAHPRSCSRLPLSLLILHSICCRISSIRVAICFVAADSSAALASASFCLAAPVGLSVVLDSPCSPSVGWPHRSI